MGLIPGPRNTPIQKNRTKKKKKKNQSWGSCLNPWLAMNGSWDGPRMAKKNKQKTKKQTNKKHCFKQERGENLKGISPMFASCGAGLCHVMFHHWLRWEDGEMGKWCLGKRRKHPPPGGPGNGHGWQKHPALNLEGAYLMSQPFHPTIQFYPPSNKTYKF